MLKQGLDVKLGQSLSMTPQMQQAIRLLQLSSIELEQEIQITLNSNPLLEQVEDSYEADIIPPENDQYENQDSTNTETSSIEENIPTELSVDSSWDEVFDSSTWQTSGPSNENNANLVETLNASEEGLKEHLLWQITMSNLSAQDKLIAETIIDCIDDHGYLLEDVNEIHASLSKHLLIDPDEVEAVLRYIQHLDPSGVGARNLSECLSLQLETLYPDHNLQAKAHLLLEKHLDLLTKRDYTGIKKALNLSELEYSQLVKLLKSLNPRPGDAFSTATTDYIAPDVFVKKMGGTWIAILNSDNTPELRVNKFYEEMIPKTRNSADSKYLKNNLQEARWFLKTLENRSSTILNVANAIIRRQSAFLNYGEMAMKPMILRDIADELGIHESTISRVTTHKYMRTPHGIYEFKYFFSSHVTTNTGGECSATAIRAIIQNLVKTENAKKPLSDNKLMALLKNQGINVARRTVAKYREALSIPSSHERKTLA
jgi:RNA polymerase sigma-54 factor